jgi:hypothetical protein
MGAMFDVGDELLIGFDSRKADIDYDGVTDALCQACLELQASSDARFQALRSPITSTLGIYLPVRATFHEEYASLRKAKGDPDYRNALVLNGSMLVELKQICVTKIRDAAENGSLAVHPELKTLLQHWRAWGQEKEVKDYCGQLVKSGPWALLEQFLGDAVSENPDVTFIEKYEPALQALSNLVEMDLVFAYLKRSDPALLSLRQQQVRDFFLRHYVEYRNHKGMLPIPE